MADYNPVPSDLELWMVACDLVHRHGHRAHFVATSWQAEFSEAGVEEISLSWKAVGRRIADLQRTRPFWGEALQ